MEKGGFPQWRPTIKVTAARTSGLDDLVFSRQTGFFECKLLLFEPAVAGARLLRLGSKATWRACSTKISLKQSLSRVRQKRKKGSSDRVVTCG